MRRAPGVAKRWLCPYHQWSYALDGTLLGCGGMEQQIDRSRYGLHRAAVAEIGGLVYVWAGADPEQLGEARAALAGALAPQGLERAKVAHEIDYLVAANWKLVWENNRECWHCHAGHPQYIKANFDIAPDTPRVRELALSRTRDHERALADVASAHGPAAPDEHPRPGLYPFPTAERWWSANRTPLAPGFLTESIDGRPVAPLMGDYTSHDVGTLQGAKRAEPLVPRERRPRRAHAPCAAQPRDHAGHGAMAGGPRCASRGSTTSSRGCSPSGS